MEELFFIDNATLNNPPKAQCPRDTSIKFLPMVPDSASGTVTLTAERLLGEMDFYNSDNEDPSEEIGIRMEAWQLIHAFPLVYYRDFQLLCSGMPKRRLGLQDRARELNTATNNR